MSKKKETKDPVHIISWVLYPNAFCDDSEVSTDDENNYVTHDTIIESGADSIERTDICKACLQISIDNQQRVYDDAKRELTSRKNLLKRQK